QIDVNYTEDNFITSGYSAIREYGIQSYSFLRGFTNYDGNAMLAASCDEADFARPSQMQYFNMGAWGVFNNPDNVFSHYYKGIRHINLFLEKTTAYKTLLVKDTITNMISYISDCDDIFRLRAESRFLRAYYYMELIKRYGGVPIITEVLLPSNDALPARNTFDECVDFIVKECDEASLEMADYWVNYGVPAGGQSGDGHGDCTGSTDMSRLGRAEKVAAKALKMRALLYAASPLNNPSNDIEKWKRAAAAGNDFFANTQFQPWFTLNFSYWEIFCTQNDLKYLTSQKGRNTGIIFTVPYELNGNGMERYNYPVGAPSGGQAVTAPSQNLVDAFEMTNGAAFDWSNPSHTANPYSGRDPRFRQMIAYNNAVFGRNTDNTDRQVQSYEGGPDAIGSKQGATTTGYYLKKFCVTNYNLSLSTSVKPKAWVLMRTGEMYLNLAEAMNEAYGPDAKPVINGAAAIYSAREALNKVRTRSDVNLPAIATGQTQEAMREKIRHERRIELAFEEQRPFDIRRWKIPVEELNQPLQGMIVHRNGSSYTYEKFDVEKRVFEAKMYRYPIPFEEISKSKGILTQNEGW
ncbi:MAG: RagB/SusD family nutrient uptake outer membrane protein, partial [Dysgonamonadaceae bacterium]|nr:RagB/SusD family nutrient uptake outer membrane protein [Dysgonamonadaceae bacterium]